LDLNSTLKFNYYKHLFESNSVTDFLVFNSGYLVYSTLSKDLTAFFQSYLYGTGEPYQFKFSVFHKKFRLINNTSSLTSENNYGTLFSTQISGEETVTSATDIRFSGEVNFRKTRSTNSFGDKNPNFER
jgi:hypothetical protein